MSLNFYFMKNKLVDESELSFENEYDFTYSSLNNLDESNKNFSIFHNVDLSVNEYIDTVESLELYEWSELNDIFISVLNNMNSSVYNNIYPDIFDNIGSSLYKDIYSSLYNDIYPSISDNIYSSLLKNINSYESKDIDSIYYLPSNLLEDSLEIKLSGVKRKRK